MVIIWVLSLPTASLAKENKEIRGGGGKRKVQRCSGEWEVKIDLDVCWVGS